ncbi:MAG: arginine--tRNA ligase, partial [Candidatus Sumerlaeota bacterium]
MDLKQELIERLENALDAYTEAEGVERPESIEVAVEVPRNREHGDLATNLAMQLTKVMKRNPRQVAEELLSHLQGEGLVEGHSIAGPGFINFKLSSEATTGVLKKIAAEREAYGHAAPGTGDKVLIEFVSANPTGPLHIGHARGAIVGDVLGRLLEAAGHQVTREYYFNDAGVQMNLLGNTLRLRVLEQLGEDVTFPEPKVDPETGESHAQYYRGEYMIEIAKLMVEELGEEQAAAPAKQNPPDIKAYRDFAVREILKTIDEDLKELGIDFDSWFSETTLHESGEVGATLEELRERGRLFDKDGATWLKTTDYGDEKDRVVVKSDGNYTYVTPDIAYHRDKYARGYDRLINVLGGDHHGYVPRLRAAVAALGHPYENLQCVIVQMVSLLKSGETMKLSTRSGEFITLKQMREELGTAVVRYFFAMRSPDTQMTFDWDLAKDTSMDNPVYYVQYAHARCCSLLRRAEEEGCAFQDMDSADLSLLELEEEQAIIQALGRLPEVVETATSDLAPQVVTNYLYDVAQIFHNYFTKGNTDASMRVIVTDKPDLTQAR